jgi:hypothetical protein
LSTRSRPPSSENDSYLKTEEVAHSHGVIRHSDLNDGVWQCADRVTSVNTVSTFINDDGADRETVATTDVWTYTATGLIKENTVVGQYNGPWCYSQPVVFIVSFYYFFLTANVYLVLSAKKVRCEQKNTTV